MNKKIIGILIILLIVIKPFSKGYLDLADFNIIPIAYYLVLLILGVLFFKDMKPSKSFWICMLLYVAIIIGLILFNIYN